MLIESLWRDFTQEHPHPISFGEGDTKLLYPVIMGDTALINTPMVLQRDQN